MNLDPAELVTGTATAVVLAAAIGGHHAGAIATETAFTVALVIPFLFWMFVLSPALAAEASY